MSKKKKSEAKSVLPAPGALTHNPFAALSKLDERPPQQPEPQQPAPEQQPEPLPASVPARPEAAPTPSAPARPKSAGRLILRRETKHRAGKAVIVISGFSALAHHDAQATRALAQRLKQQLGCGGTVEATRGEREIVLQGDRAAAVAELLRGLGFRVDGVTR